MARKKRKVKEKSFNSMVPILGVIFVVVLLLAIVLLVTKGDESRSNGVLEDQDLEEVVDYNYENTNLGFSIIYPNNWQAYTPEESVVYFGAGDLGEMPYISVSVKSSEGKDTRDYGMNLANQLRRLSETGIRVLQTEGKQINSVYAWEITYTLENDVEKLKYRKIIFVEDSKAYELDYVSTIDDYNTYLSTINEAVNSFSIL
jgi:hypothetical protein